MAFWNRKKIDQGRDLKVVNKPPRKMSKGVNIFGEGNVSINIDTVQEAQIGIKQLKIHKKEMAILKRQVNAQMKQIRAEYRLKSAQNGSMMRGGGKAGKFVRTVQRVNRDAARADKENALAPLESEKLRLDRVITRIDTSILELESYVAHNS